MYNLVRSASLVVAIAAASGTVVWSQARRPPQSPYLASPDNVVAVRAGRMFDARAGTMLNNQIILIKGDRIADSGPSVHIPPEARVIDLSGATVLPGMIDGHVHNAGRGDSVEMKTIVMVQSAARDLDAGFTTVVDMDSRGGFGTVDLRDAINEGLIKGPRMQVSGQSLNQRASSVYPNPGPGFYEGHTESKNINGPWLARAAVREAKLHGVDWIKIYTTQDFVGEELDERSRSWSAAWDRNECSIPGRLFLPVILALGKELCSAIMPRGPESREFCRAARAERLGGLGARQN